MILKTALALALVALSAGVAQAADYPVRPHHRRVVVEREPPCYVGRYANFRYVTVLATDYMIRPVFVRQPVPCLVSR